MGLTLYLLIMIIRVRDAGASGRECSALAGRHYLPPRQAGFTSFLTKKSNCNPLEDVASPHWAKTSLSSTLRIISRGGRVALPSDRWWRPYIGFEAGDALDFEPRGGCKVLHLGSRKNLPNRFVSQDEELGGGADARTSGGPCSAFGRDTVRCSKWRGENELQPLPEECLWNSITSFYIRYEVSVKVVSQDTMTRIVNFKYCPLCKTYFCDDCLRR